MSEYERQRAEKPPLNETASRLLTGEARENALRFAAFLRENHLAPQWSAVNSYNAAYKSRRVCTLKLFEDGFDIWVSTRYDEDFNRRFSGESPETRAFLLNSVALCSGCGECKPGRDAVILGRPYQGACLHPVVRVLRPDANALSLAEALVLLRKDAICKGNAPKVAYISVKKRSPER